ncbi:MAG: glycosyltransferase family A protein [Crocinitomicaceae bacterium]
MPVKNASDFLEECLDSILNQSFENWELIAVDDHSEDHSSTILDAYSVKDSRIKWLKNEGDGIISALQTAFESSSGSFISRMDADDLMPVNKLLTLYKGLRRREKVVVTAQVRYFSENEVSEGYRRYENWLNEVVRDHSFKDYLYRECVIASPNWMVHRHCFEKYFRFSSLNYPEDYDMVFQWVKAGYKLEGIEAITHLWREHPKRTSRNSDIYQQASFFRLKTTYFLAFHKENKDEIQLIGSSKKAKLVAELLREKDVDFRCFDLNTSKDQVHSVHELKPQLSILTNWPLAVEEQETITSFLASKGLIFGKNLWLF